jgi:predicted transcriptional regulator
LTYKPVRYNSIDSKYEKAPTGDQPSGRGTNQRDWQFKGMFISHELPMQQGSALLFTKFSEQFWAKFRTPSHGFVMLRILRNCGFDGSRVCFESQSAMATACCCSVRTLSTLVKELEDSGFINVNRQLKHTNQITLTPKTLSYMEKIDVIGKVCRQKR